MIKVFKDLMFLKIYPHIFYGGFILWCLSYGTEGLLVAEFFAVLYVSTVFTEQINSAINNAIIRKMYK